MHSSLIAVLIIGAILAAVTAYFLPEQETVITRSAASEEIRESVSVVSPWVTELKDFKDLQELRK